MYFKIDQIENPFAIRCQMPKKTTYEFQTIWKKITDKDMGFKMRANNGKAPNIHVFIKNNSPHSFKKDQQKILEL